jgi:putative pyruvate formate lyase activating enzyme
MSARDKLAQYFAILANKRTANYLAAKKITLEFDATYSEEVLWELHEKKSIKESSKTLFDLKLALAEKLFQKCRFCEHRCCVNRAKGERGHCRVLNTRIATEFIHWGEEPELIPSYTIFFASCTFHCVFCQNWDISQSPEAGITLAPEKLAKLIEKRFKNKEVKNLNLVGGDPTPNLKYILEVLRACNANIPIVWNSNMYLSEESMRILDGIVDLYLTDFKYGNDKCAKRLSKIDNYFEIVSRNHKIGNKQCELLIRHLVLPNHFNCCTKPILDWLAENLELEKVRVNIMAQYRPEYNAYEYEEIARRLTWQEFEEAYEYAAKLGLDLVER